MSPSLIDAIGSILAIVCTSVLTVVIVFLVQQHRRTIIAMKHKTLLELIERGAAIPDGLLGTSAAPRTDADLRRGLVLVLGGIGFSLFALTLPKQDAWGFGLFLIFTGLGFLLTWKLSKAEKSKSTDA